MIKYMLCKLHFLNQVVMVNIEYMSTVNYNYIFVSIWIY